MSDSEIKKLSPRVFRIKIERISEFLLTEQLKTLMMTPGFDVKKLRLESPLYKKYLEMTKVEYEESSGDGKPDESEDIDPKDIETEVVG